ncbi:mycofactocin precursor [Streptomyces sp. PSKA54]|uniref:Mycofactocin n=1 Tax=Streptomyces himalayensis subsp. aureolus TaxID=2758039 RepID=A0A7W2D2F8_9ACTN|nr:mycofactocin precursor MftA [Streptomyces himalayensis]MBA4863569.1 mycofactocin precursor [Streptomyces himalayensis subsp. aureolus]
MNETNSTQAEQNHADEIASPDGLIEAEDLIEEVSIDGMCGVY